MRDQGSVSHLEPVTYKGTGALPRTRCVTMGKSLNLYKPCLSFQSVEDNNP